MMSVSQLRFAVSTQLFDRRFRPNPAYELRRLDELPADERQALASLASDPDFFGVLRPLGGDGALRLKSICNSVAQLLQSLGVDGRVPPFIVANLGSRAEAEIADLVLEEVLQVAIDDVFVSGARAHQLISAPLRTEQRGFIGSLSIEAIKYGQHLTIDNPLLLSAQIYFYNRAPVTSRWQRRIGGNEGFARFVGTYDGGPCARLLDTWKRAASTPASRGWMSWVSRHTRTASLPYKLYVSPTLEGVPDALPKILAAFREQQVARFKIGADLPGLARPDKIVAYFESREELDRVAQTVAARLAGWPAHGVPFTGELADGGLLSWGVDPRDTQLLDLQERTSWRLWITHRAAAALLDARRQPDLAVAPWEFALQRLAHDGIDTESWTPSDRYMERAR